MPCIRFGLILISGLLLSSVQATANSDFRFRLTADPVTLDWNLAHTSYETPIIMNLMEGLVEEGPDLKPRPALAEKWDISSDGKLYTFTLRAGVKWSDGRPLKASDFVDSWRRLLSPKTKSPYASFLFDVEGAEAFHAGKAKESAVGVKAIGENQFQVRLAKTVPYFIHLPTFWVTYPIRLDLIKKHGGQWATPGKIATLGPFRLAEWQKGKQIVLSKNTDYFNAASVERPSIQNVTAVIEPDDAKARSLFEEGKLDVLLNATTADLLKAKALKDVRVEQYPYLATYYVGFNVNSGPMKNIGARRAVARALSAERENLPALLQGGQLPARGWIPPGIDGNASGVQLGGSLYDARSDLARAGFAEGRGFPKAQFWVERFDGAEAMAAYLAKSLREKLGIELEPRVGSSAEFQQALNSGQTAIFVNHWGADFPDAANFFEVFSSGSGTVYTGWKSPEYDRYMEQARATLDQPSRLVAYAAAEKILLERDIVVLPLFYRKNAVLLGERVGSFQISPLNYLFFKQIRLKQSGATP